MVAKVVFNAEELARSIALLFDQAQSSVATHKKNCVALYKYHAKAATEIRKTRKGKSYLTELIGENAFNDTVLSLINKTLTVKKGVPVADKIIKFMGAYVQFLGGKYANGDHHPSMLVKIDDDDSITRFIDRLLQHCLQGIACRNKWVRYRTICLLIEVVCNAGEIDEDTYFKIRIGLLERLQDKETFVRSSSAIALCKLVENEDPDMEEAVSLLSALSSSLRFDAAPEVRRAILVNMPLTPVTLSVLLTRTLDEDALTRKLVYTTVLTKFTHPKQLTMTQRELILRRGLEDREDSVRVAAVKVICSWIEILQDDLVEFLKMFDFIDNEVSVEALNAIFAARSDIVDNFEFPDAYWNSLRPETTLLARAFVEHCIVKKYENKLETVMPVLTQMVFYIQARYKILLDLLERVDLAALQDDDSSEDESLEEEIANALFIEQQLLRLSLHMDFSDEIGRRKLFVLIREMIGQVILPEGLIRPCLEILHKLTPNKRDFVRLIVEVINELRDPMSNQKQTETESLPFTESQSFSVTRSKTLVNDLRLCLTAEEKLQANLTDYRCLDLCIAALENINSSFEENSTLEGVLNELIVPSVERKELPLRERGMVALGLCCLVSRNMAMNAFQLFLNQISSAPERLKVKVIKIVFDILLKWEEILGRPDGRQVVAFLMQVLDAEESKEAQFLLSLGFSKLLLFGLITDVKVLTGLVLAYVSPGTTDNQSLKQCLAYFLPVYCFASATNQERMRSIFITLYDTIIEMQEDDSDDADAINPWLFCQLFLDWTNPNKLILPIHTADVSYNQSHLHLAVDVLRALYDSDRTTESKKYLCQLLSNTSLPRDVEEHLLYTIIILLINLQEQCPIEDSATIKIYNRAKTRIITHFSSQLHSFDELSCFGTELYEELFEFIGVTRPREHPDLFEFLQNPPKRRSRQSLEDREVSETHEQSEASDVSESTHEFTDSQLQDPEGSKNLLSPIIQHNGNDLKAKSKGKKNAANSSSKNKSKGTVNESEDEGAKENRPVPITPTRKRATKRGRSPSKSKHILSPAHKRAHGDATNMRGYAKGKNKTVAIPKGGLCNDSDIASTISSEVDDEVDEKENNDMFSAPRRYQSIIDKSDSDFDNL